MPAPRSGCPLVCKTFLPHRLWLRCYGQASALSYADDVVAVQDPVQMRCAVAVALLSATVVAQTVSPSCPADRPVDDIIAELHTQHSDHNQRNTNPLPQLACSWGWCIDHSRTPPTFPEPAPQAKMPGDAGIPSSRVNSGGTPFETCADATKMALQAAHDVEVGDLSFAEKNYSGALLRYREAVEEKPGDLSIHVRLGRVLEKLNQLPQAIEQYQAAQKLAGPKKWSDEAKAAVRRLQRSPSL